MKLYYTFVEATVTMAYPLERYIVIVTACTCILNANVTAQSEAESRGNTKIMPQVEDTPSIDACMKICKTARKSRKLSAEQKDVLEKCIESSLCDDEPTFFAHPSKNKHH